MPEQARRIAPSVPDTEWLKPLPPAARFILHGDQAARARAAPVWGAAFSERPLRAAVRDGRATLWLGPDEYLLYAAGEAGEPEARLARQLEAALDGSAHALVDLGHRQTAVEIRGPHAAAILNGACPLDLDLDAFPIDMCTRTVFAKADIVLWRRDAQTFHVEIWRSFTDYVTRLLAEIARDH